MLPAFKVYCKNMVVGGLSGAAVGAAAGSAAGKVGLNQLCNIPGVTKDICSPLVDKASEDAVQMGAATGAAIGFGIGFFLYPIYKGVADWCRGEREDFQNQVVSSSGIELTGNNSGSSWWKLRG